MGACGPLVSAQDAVVRQGDLAQQRHLAPADQADIGDPLVGSPERADRHTGGPDPVKPATRWMRGVSKASASITCGNQNFSMSESMRSAAAYE